MIQTVIFDMDGVIVDTEPVHKYAYYKHFEELKLNIPEEVYTTFTGNSTKNVYQKIKDNYGILTEVEELVLRKRALFNDAFDTKPDLELISGVRALIEDLHNNEVQLILASSASMSTINRVFNRFELFPFFTHIVSGENFPKSKPDPAIFLHAASLSVAAKEHCVIIEDSTNGVKAAVAADINCIAYHSKNSKMQDLRGAKFFISDFADFKAKDIKGLSF